MHRDYKPLFAICKKHGFDYKDKVAEFTENRTDSLRALTDGEFREFMLRMRKLDAPQVKGEDKFEDRKKMRGSILHFMCLMGYVDMHDKPDYQRIDNFIINIGARNPRKVILNYLYPNELKEVLTQIQSMYKKELTR